jgi:hypothetical protein
MLQHRKKLEDEYGQIDAREAQEGQEILEFERRSGGRNTLLKKPGQVLFTNNHECPFCKVPVKYAFEAGI